MKFTIEIDCNNAAFEDAPLEEVARILTAEADKLRRWGDANTWDNTVLDLCGNKVGRACLIE